MSSRGHDFILEMMQIKIKKEGYNIISSECRYRDIKKKIPPTIINHRPDAIGYNSGNGSICIGEAKYYGDFTSKRSETQITDFISLTRDKKRKISVMFGIPASESENFRKILKKNGQELNTKVEILKIPDRLIPNSKQNEEA